MNNRGERIAVVLNTRSGPEQRTAEGRIREAFATAQIPLNLFAAGSGTGVEEQARKAAQARFTTLVAAGGDGTVNAVAQVTSKSDAVLGILPLGTFNHFAKDLGVPLELPLAVEAIKQGRTRDVDVGEVNGRVFLNTSSLGLYPRMVLERERSRRAGVGRWDAALFASLSAFRAFDRLHVRLSSETLHWEGETPFLFVGNNEYSIHAGHVGQRRGLDGGTLFVCAATTKGRVGLLRLAAEAVLGGLTLDPALHLAWVTDFWVDTNRLSIPVSIDGEVETMGTPLRYVSRPRALRVVVP